LNNIKNFTAVILGGFLLCSTPLYAQEIETITVTGSVTQEVVSDPAIDISILESLFPETTVAGKFGGFAGFSERGTQPTHTTVFRNGVPANDPGAGWYDFGHDLSTGSESVKVVNGPNSVLYGSGSLGGTIFITDDIKPGTIIRLGDQHKFVSQSYEDVINITYFDTSNGSVRTDNDEEDRYKNITARANFDIGDWQAKINYTDYTYDFDQCWNNNGIFTNSCFQEGKKGTVSIRNENTTLGYSFNDADFYALEDKTWTSEAKRYFADHRQDFVISHDGFYIAEVLVGATAEREEYAGNDQTNVAVYGVAKRGYFEVGTRVTQDASVFRFGAEYKNFFANVGTSYRNPSLYQIHGDAWTNPNTNLNPEEAFGFEFGYGNLSFFNYKFSEGIDYSYADNQYVNTGKYDTRGARYVDNFFPTDDLWLRFDVGYTDSDQPRVAKYKFVATGNYHIGDYTAKLTYTGLFDRKASAFDLGPVEDISSFDLSIQTRFDKNILLSLTARDILDREFEVVPGYSAGGRQIFLTIQYNPSE
jgi:outer membrane cobalamin receptor